MNDFPKAVRQYEYDPAETTPDAQLIAAAPELYEALRALVDITNESRGVAGWNLNGDDEPWEKFPQLDAAVAALAKARGGVQPMSESKMTAAEMVAAEAFPDKMYPDGPPLVTSIVAIRIAEKYAKAAVAEVTRERDEAIAECEEADQCFEDIATALRCGRTGDDDAGCDCSLKSPMVLAIDWRSRAEKAEARVAELDAAARELLEVADLRGDADLPHPEDDEKLWTARMQEAWNDLRAALAPQAPPARKEVQP